MYQTLFKCVKMRQKSLLLLPIIPESLIENWRKRQGAAPKPRYLLVDKSRCKKVLYPHTYLYPAMTVSEFNALVQKVTVVLEIGKTKYILAYNWNIFVRSVLDELH